MTKRVLLFSHEFPPYVGGVGTVGYQLAGLLVKEGFAVTVLTRVQKDRADVPGAHFIDVDVLRGFWFWSYWQVLRKLDLADYDHIILNEAAPTIVAGRYFTKGLLAKCVVLLHGLEVESLYNRTPNNLLRQTIGFRRNHERACERAAAVFAASNAMAGKFRAALPTLNREVQTMYLGVSNGRFYPEKSDYRQARGLSPSTRVLVSGSRVTREKGYPAMYAVFRQLLARDLDVYWVICGDGDYLTTLRQQAKADGIDDRISFEGACTADQLRQVYNASDLYWLISDYEEAFGLCYVEAQLTGLATIGRRRGGVAEAITEGVTGWLVDQPEQVLTLIPALFGNGRIPARETVAREAKQFRAETTTRPLMELLRRPG